jgi:hypothetical protein
MFLIRFCITIKIKNKIKSYNYFIFISAFLEQKDENKLACWSFTVMNRDFIISVLCLTSADLSDFVTLVLSPILTKCLSIFACKTLFIILILKGEGRDEVNRKKA